jgi:hypothetical protein
VLRPREVTEEAVVGDGLEQEEGALAALLADELHGAVLPDLFREEERNQAVINAESGPSRTVIPAHRGQRSGDCGQFLTNVQA